MKQSNTQIQSFDGYFIAICRYLDSIEDLLVGINYNMDKMIKKEKKNIVKGMDKLVKADVMRDKECDHDKKMAKKKAKK